MGNLRTEDLAASARNVGYPVVGLVPGLSQAAGEAGGWTHWGATTQDIMDTATVLQVRHGLDLIETELRGDPDGAGGARRSGTAHTVMAGRTHLQQALPITFGLKCAIWAMPFLAHLRAAAPASPPRPDGRVRRRRRHAGLAGRAGHRGHAGAGGRNWASAPRSRRGMSAATR